MGEKRIWISWAYQRRSAELAREFAAEYHHFGDATGGRVRRYLRCMPGTLKLLFAERPGVCFVQNPSLILTAMAVLLRSVLRYRLVNDLHTPYLRLSPSADRLFWMLQRFCAEHADLTLVTNCRLAARFPRGPILVLPDKLPDFAPVTPRTLAGRINVMYVGSFAQDEPFEEVKEAARSLDPSIHLYMTGHYAKARWDPAAMPPTVHLTGYLSDPAYVELLYSVDVVMVLTKQPDCLVCGAYEAVSAGKPLVLSDHDVLREYFSRGAVYVENSARGIAEGITRAVAARENLASDIVALRESLARAWRAQREAVSEHIDRISRQAT